MTQKMKSIAVAGLVGAICLAATPVASAADLELSSSAFDNGQPIPKRFSCDGEGISPPLTLKGVPPKAKSLTLIVDDPDAPSGDWTHWVVYDLAPNPVMLVPGVSGQSLPGPAVTATNSFHDRGYGGVCPPKGNGKHHYRFTLYALDTRLPDGLDNKAAVRKAMRGHILSKTRLVGTYVRQ